MSTIAKKTVVQEVKDNCSSSEMIFFIDFKGVAVAAERTLRRDLHAKSAFMKVAKARLVKIALRDLGAIETNPVLEKLVGGQVAVVFAKQESQFVAKSLADFQRKSGREVFVMGGLYKDRVYDKANVFGIAKLPSKQMLIQKLAFTINAPLTSLARVIKEVAEKN